VYVYPGPLDATGVGAFVSTVRFDAQRDGIEDWHVFVAAAAKAGADMVMPLVKSMVSGPQSFSRNCTLLELTRKALLEMASS